MRVSNAIPQKVRLVDLIAGPTNTISEGTLHPSTRKARAPGAPLHPSTRKARVPGAPRQLARALENEFVRPGHVARGAAR